MSDPIISIKDSVKALACCMAAARFKHPWKNQELEYIALLDEVRELGEALRTQGQTNAKIDAEAIRSEALDCAVVAMRIVEGS